MPPSTKPTYELAKKYFADVEGNKNPPENEVTDLLAAWMKNASAFSMAMQLMKSPKKTETKASTEPKPTYSLAKEYTSKVMGDDLPDSDEIAGLVKFWTGNPAAFKKALQSLQSFKNTKMLGDPSPALDAELKASKVKLPAKPATPAKVPTPAVAKGPTWAAQLKSLAEPFGMNATANYGVRDNIEISNLFAAVKKELQDKLKQNGNAWSEKYKSAIKQVSGVTERVKDPIHFLQAVLKHINPNAKPFDLNTKVKPGEFYGMPVPTDKLSDFAKQHIPDPGSQKKALELAKKIADYEALIAKLKAEKEKAEKNKHKAISDKDKLGGMDEQLLKYFSYIEKNCSEYLASVKESGGKLLYRGNDDASQPIYIANPRTDRQPKDSDPEAQKLLDGYLSAVGFKALRSNSIFTSANIHQASNYGTVYAIFPKNGFSFTWSTKHDDLVMHSPEEYDLGGGDDSEEVSSDYEDWISMFDQLSSYELYDYFSDNYEKLGIPIDKDGDPDEKYIRKLQAGLQKMPEHKALMNALRSYAYLDPWDDPAIKFHQRFIIVVNAYLALEEKTPIRLFSPTEKNILQKLIVNAKKAVSDDELSAGKVDMKKAQEVVKRQGFTNEKLPAAMKARHEVCILGEYIAINYEKYEDEIDKYFIKPHKVAKVKKPKE